MPSLYVMAELLTVKITADEPGEVRVEAPPGYVWREGVHELVCHGRRDAVARMDQGFVECDDPECDWCRDNGVL